MSLASLPAELLLDIFRSVFTSKYSTCSSPSCYTCLRIGSGHVAWGPTQSFNTSDPTLFPFALAAVLPRWRDVLSTVPEYWTRPVFYLDGTIADIDIAQVLQFSKNLPLEVYVTRRAFPLVNDVSAVDYGEEEAIRMREVMDALKPHLPRCQHIFIHTFRSSSLPSLRHDFSRHCPFLTQLKLECSTDDGLNSLAHNQHLPTEKFTCPAIYTLHVDGPNFREIAMKRYKSWWINAFKPTRTLSIQNLTPASGSPVQYVPALEYISLSTLPNLSTLILSNVAFDKTSVINAGSDTSPPFFTFTLNMLVLSSMSFSFLSHFFQYSFLGDLYNIRLDACGTAAEDLTDIHLLHMNFPATFSLTLQNISHPHHLNELLRTWNGHRLNLISCAGFDDSVLEMMRKPQDPTTVRIGCPHLSVLYLSDCTNFTSAALNAMVNARNGGHGTHADGEAITSAMAPAAGGTGTSDGGAIELVTVTGDAPMLTDAERRDFGKSDVILWKSGLLEEGEI